MSGKIPDPLIPLADACRFTALKPEALRAAIGCDPEQTSFKFSALIELLKQRTVAQQQAARARAAANARKGSWLSELLRARR